MAEAMKVFKAELWTSTILKNLKIITGMRSHSDYSFNKDIKHGTILHITKLGDTQVRPYTQGKDITFDDVDGTEKELIINQRRYFGKYYDDVDNEQAIANTMQEDMAETAQALAEDADKFVSARLYQAVESGDIAKSEQAITPSEKNTLQAIEKGLVHLYSKNVKPSTKIYGEISPKFYSEFRIHLNELATQNIELLKDGAIGRYSNVEICIENLLPVKTGVKYNFLRTGKAFAYAEQINKVKLVDKENGFGKKFKGLMVYGGVVVRPEEAYAIQETTDESDSDFLDR